MTRLPTQPPTIPANCDGTRLGLLGCSVGYLPRRASRPTSDFAWPVLASAAKATSDSDDAGGSVMLWRSAILTTTIGRAGERPFEKAERYSDFRKMLDEMGKSIDAVTVSTPDHIHAGRLMAMRMGKHCFCQKPLTHTMYEARLVGE